MTHLDPVLESTYFKKALGYFPSAVQEVLGELGAARHPHVVSLRDAYFPRWGESCPASAAAAGAGGGTGG